MPPAYLRSPSALQAERVVYIDGCSSRTPKTRKEARTHQRRRGDQAYECPICTRWHNQISRKRAW